MSHCENSFFLSKTVKIMIHIPPDFEKEKKNNVQTSINKNGKWVVKLTKIRFCKKILSL